MFSSIVVGIDGSDTAREAMRQATALARSVGARIELVTAYEPVTDTRLRETIVVPQDLHWMVNPRDDAVAGGALEATLDVAGLGLCAEHLRREHERDEAGDVRRRRRGSAEARQHLEAARRRDVEAHSRHVATWKCALLAVHIAGQGRVE